MHQQLEITRGNVVDFVKSVDSEIVDKQPQGFNNTIQWHIGHILTAAESFLFGQDSKLPREYPGLFGYGTRPSEWKSEVPSVEVLLTQLKEQKERIKAIPAEVFEQKLPEPVFGLDTLGAVYAFILYHEAEHLGLMKAMKKFLEA